MRYVPLGGGHQIGASTALLELDGVRVLIDAGLDPARPDRIPDFLGLVRVAGLSTLEELDALVLTHAHLDHVGAVLDLLARAPRLPVLCHPHTARLMRPILATLPGVADLQGRGRGLTALADALAPSASLTYSSPITITGKTGSSLILTLLDAGHIPGSACLHFRGQQQTALITGDFNHISSLFLVGTGANPAFQGLTPDLMVIEGTYAGRAPELGPGTRAPEELVALTRQVLLRGGRVIAPAFALGRAQEVLGWLEQGLEQGLLPELRLWTDEPIRRNTALWRSLFPGRLEHPTLKEALPDERAALAEGTRTSLRAERWKAAESCNFVLTSPGMVQAGAPSQKHVIAALSDLRSAIFLTGHQLEGTLGARLQQKALGRKRMAGAYQGSGFYPLKADVYSFQMSAHADHAGLVGLIQQTTPRMLVMVHRHDDHAALARFCESIQPLEIRLPKNGETILCE